MARIEVGADGITVHLSVIEEVLSLHSSLNVPYVHVRSVSAERIPNAWFRGVKVGTNIPGLEVAGSFITEEGVIFYDFHDPARCLTLELEHERYRRVVVEVHPDQNPETLAREIQSRIPKRGDA